MEAVLNFVAQHTIAVGAAGFVLATLLIRTAYWKVVQPTKVCETCNHQGKARRIVRGKSWVEMPIVMLGMTVGMFVHILLMFSLLVFLWRTFGSYLVCDNCSSERLV